MTKLRNIPFIPPVAVTLSALLVFLFYYFMASPLMADPDTPWHIAAGRYILTHGQIPITDPWSYTSNYMIWYNIAWLWDLILGAIDQWLGLYSLYNVMLLLYAAMLGLLAWGLIQRQTIRPIAIVLTTCMVGFVLWKYVGARPQWVTYTLVILFHILLHRSRTHSFSRSGLWLLPLLTSFWVNAHGGFLAGIILIGAYGFESLVTRQWAWFKMLFVTGAMCVFALFTGFYGWEIITAVLYTLSSPITAYITEWRPFTFDTHQLGITGFVCLFILVSNLREKNIPLADKLLAFAWLFAAMQSSRNFAVFGLMAAPYIAYNLSAFGWAKQVTDRLRNYQRPGMAGATFFISGLMLVVFLLLPPVRTMLGTQETVMDTRFVPVDVMEFVQKNYPDTTFINSYILGGYLIYYTDGKIRPSIDGRAGTAYPVDALQAHILVLTMGKDWEKVIDTYKVQGMILTHNEKFSGFYNTGVFDKTWKRVFKGEVASVYIKL